MDKKKKKVEHIDHVNKRARKLESLFMLGNEIRQSESRFPLSFNDWLHMASSEPRIIFRNIFQLFNDMVNHYIPEGTDDYPISGEHAGFLDYDTSKIFEENCSEPFFADRLFANRLMALVENMRKGTQNNHIYLFEGPPGSGKSTFLNILLSKFEEYTHRNEGSVYKTLWRLDPSKINTSKKIVTSKHFDPDFPDYVSEVSQTIETQHYTYISCPSNDSPITLIPRELRHKFLDELITDKKFKHELFHSKEYEWVFKDIPCSICSSLFNQLLDITGDPLEVFSMVYARKTTFSRQFGKGISIYNPGDEFNPRPITNPTIQNIINELFKSDEIRYVYSHLAYTNNGIYALMDIKENNIQRLKNLHGIISDGIHKVEHTEEMIRSFFVGLINPEDKKHYEDIQSFRDRVISVKIPYVLDYNIECKILKNKFSADIEKKFLPRVLSNFAKIIIATRLEKESYVFDNWLKNKDKYKKYIDPNLMLLKMELYTGKIPAWLSPEDVKAFTRPVRKEIISETETEGKTGISGRMSLNVFNDFLNQYFYTNPFIHMGHVIEFFENHEQIKPMIPAGFIYSLNRLYEFDVLQRIKEAIFYYNEKQITKDILNYIFALNYEPGDNVKSTYTGDNIEITEDYFKNFEAFFLGVTSSESERKDFRKEIHHEYVTKTLAQEIKVKKKKIEESELFNELYQKYSNNLKEHSLEPYAENDLFRNTVKEFGTSAFEKADPRMKKEVTRLIENLCKKSGYTPEGAVYAILLTIDKNLHKEFDDFRPY